MKVFVVLFVCTMALGLYMDYTGEMNSKVPVRAALNLGVVYYHAEEWDKARYWLTVSKNSGYKSGTRHEGICQDKAALYLQLMDQDRREREIMRTWKNRKTQI